MATATPHPPHAPAPAHTCGLAQGAWHGQFSGACEHDHEHGAPPPRWVLDGPWPPFTQARESHVGYKGLLATNPQGVESYLIAHILGTPGARSHGDHDYAVWVRDPSGGLSHWRGIQEYAEPGTAPIPLFRRRVDASGQVTSTDARPVILGVDRTSLSQGVPPCETWYNDAFHAAAWEVHWTVCQPHTDLDGVRLGDGTDRGAQWILPEGLIDPAHPDAVQVAPTLRQYVAVEFTARRISFTAHLDDFGHNVRGPN